MTAFTYFATFFMAAVLGCFVGISGGTMLPFETMPEASYYGVIFVSTFLSCLGIYLFITGLKKNRKYLRDTGERILMGSLMLWSLAGLWIF
ncbi:MAG: hypothetical protein LBI92_09350 [Azoarcus sp.]|jgi:hypothetical protein|nr:hypothetical protein [Azoarcus sp.]